MIGGHVRGDGATGSTGRDGERGETLVELLATIAIMGVAIVGVLLAITNAVLISDRVSAGSRAGLLTTEEAELLKDHRPVGDPLAEAPYIDCALPSDYPLVTDLPANWTVTIDEVAYWDGVDSGSDITWVDRAACQALAAADPDGDDAGTQRVTITVTSPTPRRVTERLVMVKRDQTCPVAAANLDSLPC